MSHHKHTALEIWGSHRDEYQSVFTGNVCTIQKMLSKYTARQNFLPVTAQAVTYFMHTDFVPSTLCVNSFKSWLQSGNFTLYEYYHPSKAKLNPPLLIEIKFWVLNGITNLVVRLFNQISITFNEWQKCCISITKTSKLITYREITTVYHEP